MLERMPSATLEKHHGFPSPPPPGFLRLKCIRLWRLLCPLGPEHVCAGEGVTRGVGGGSSALDQRLAAEPGGTRLATPAMPCGPQERPGSGLLPQTGPRSCPRLRIGFSSNRSVCFRKGPLELVKGDDLRHLFLGGSREGRASAPRSTFFSFCK